MLETPACSLTTRDEPAPTRLTYERGQTNVEKITTRAGAEQGKAEAFGTEGIAMGAITLRRHGPLERFFPNLTAHPAYASLALFFSNVWPVGLGAATGGTVAISAEWAYPAVVAALSGAIVQLFIAFMRNVFTERRDTLNSLREMLREQRLAVRDQDRNAARQRHELANRAHKAEVWLYLVRSGVSVDELPDVKPLYDIEQEDRETERMNAVDDINASFTPDRREGDIHRTER